MPAVRPVIWQEVGTADPLATDGEHEKEPGVVVAEYPVIAAPLVDPAVHETVTDPAPVVVVVTVGALGGAAGVTDTEVDAVPVPMALVAVIVNE